MTRLSPLLLAVLVLAALPAGAGAATHTFLNLDNNGPAQGAGTVGPSINYPSKVAVSGLAGTVTKVTVTMLEVGSGRGRDIDAVLTGPNGGKVLLVSDACGSGGVNDVIWTFDDGAPAFLSSLSCPPGKSTVMPSNYLGNAEPDDLSDDGGPEAPYVNKLAALAGGSPNGDWNLFIRDDEQDVLGFGFSAWALHLEVEPPPPPPPPAPTIVTVTVPGPPAPAPAAPAPAKTGKRAAALAKCKTKSTKQKRAACRANARKLPV